MEESGYFFKALPTKGVARKGRRAQKESKQREAVNFCVSADGEKLEGLL